MTNGQPNRKLYESVQKFIDKVIDQVEDHILGLTEQGIHIKQLISFMMILLQFGLEGHKNRFNYIIL